MGSFQFFCEDIKGKIVSSPHYLKFLIQLPNQTWPSATASNLIWGQSPKSNFVPNLSVKSYWYRALMFSKNCIIFAKLKDYLANSSNWPHSDQYIADLNNKQQFLFEKFSNLCINRANSPIGIKCDFRDWPRMTFETVAEAIFA